MRSMTERAAFAVLLPLVAPVSRAVRLFRSVFAFPLSPWERCHAKHDREGALPLRSSPELPAPRPVFQPHNPALSRPLPSPHVCSPQKAHTPPAPRQRRPPRAHLHPEPQHHPHRGRRRPRLRPAPHRPRPRLRLLDSLSPRRYPSPSGRVAQLARARLSHSRGHRFEPCRAHFSSFKQR